MTVLNMPKTHPDQTFESILELFRITNAHTGLRETMGKLLGDTKAEITRPVYGGAAKFLASIPEGTYHSFEAFLNEHATASICFPFIEREKHEDIILRLSKDKARGLYGALGLRDTSLLKSESHFCPACINEDLSNHGFSYARRTHQIQGVRSCSIHEQDLINDQQLDSSLSCSSGIITSASGEKIEPPAANEIPSSTLSDKENSFGKWVAAVYDQELCHSSDLVRVNIIATRLLRLQKLENNKQNICEYLDAVMKKSYSESFLNSIGLPLGAGDPHFPTIYVTGVKFRNNAIINLLILNAIFKDYQDFNGEVEKSNIHSKKDLLHVAFSSSVAKANDGKSLFHDLYNGEPISYLVEKYGITEDAMKAIITKTLGLGRERKKKKKSSALLEKHRTILREQLENDPVLTRSLFHYGYDSTYNWLRKNDQEWFDDALPSRRHSKGAISIKEIKKLDLDAKELFAKKVSKINSETLVTWVSPTTLISSLPKRVSYYFELGYLPKARAFMRENIESEAEFTRRAKQLTYNLIESKDYNRAIQIAADLLYQQPRNRDLIEQVVTLFSGSPRSDMINSAA